MAKVYTSHEEAMTSVWAHGGVKNWDQSSNIPQPFSSLGMALLERCSMFRHVYNRRQKTKI